MEIEKQLKGGYYDCFEVKNFETEEDCDVFYKNLLNVFYHINHWSTLFDNTIKFHLLDSDLNDKIECASIGDLLKIKIPGPKSKKGNGFDWVEVKKIETNVCSDFISHSILLSPFIGSNVFSTNHFFTSEAKNYFIIKKYLNFITVEAHGRNEIPNCKNLPLYSKFRNFFIAKGGILGGSKVNWGIWCKNILDEEYLNKCAK